MDDEGSARRATRHLIDLGHKRIGFIAGSPEYSLSRWRIDGWTAEMATAGLATGELLVEGDFTFASGAAAARQLLDRANPPTAIIASSDQMALATLEVARERGLVVPDQLSRASFDKQTGRDACRERGCHDVWN